MANDEDPFPSFEDTTKDLRRTQHIAEVLDFAVTDAEAAMKSEKDPKRQLQAAMHLHLTRAFDAGAKYSAELSSALDTAKRMIERLKRMVRDLNKRVSDSR